MADVNDKVRTLLKQELAARQVDARELARLLSLLGLEVSEAEVADRLDHGGIDAAFFVQCCEAIGAPVVSLDF